LEAGPQGGAAGCRQPESERFSLFMFVSSWHSPLCL
jgi:hypothetical protein